MTRLPLLALLLGCACALPVPPQHRQPSWSRAESEDDDPNGVGFDKSRMTSHHSSSTAHSDSAAPKRAAHRPGAALNRRLERMRNPPDLERSSHRGGGARPLEADTLGEIGAASSDVREQRFAPASVARALSTSQDPDLDGETDGPPLDATRKHSFPAPYSMPDRLARVQSHIANATSIIRAQFAPWGGWPTGGGTTAAARAAGAGADVSLAAGAAGAAGAAPFWAPAMSAQKPSGSAVTAMDSTSATSDMATAAVMAGLRGSHKLVKHHEKTLVGSTLRRAQKSLAANGFDHTNGQYGVPTAIGASGLGSGQYGIFKPDYGPFGMGPTNGAAFNMGAQPAGSRFESAPQKAVEASRTLINDVAAMPSALGGMMGTAGLGMMGNAMAGYARSLQPNPVMASGFM